MSSLLDAIQHLFSATIRDTVDLHLVGQLHFFEAFVAIPSVSVPLPLIFFSRRI
jgi:hypothetical protein